jgi:hypothetical protein
VPLATSSGTATAARMRMPVALHRRVRLRELRAEMSITRASFFVVSLENSALSAASRAAGQKFHSCHREVTDTARLAGYH